MFSTRGFFMCEPKKEGGDRRLTEMRAFQTLNSRTHFIDLITTKHPQFHKIYRGFHSTNHLFIEESSTVSTIYDPVSNRLVTTRVANSKPSEGESDKDAYRSSNSDYVDALKDDRSYGSVLKANQGFGVVSKKKSKSKSTWVCSECGYTDGQWWGYCRECRNVNTMKEFTESDNGGKTTGFQVSEKIVKSWLPKGSGDAVPMRLTDVNRGINQSDWRFHLSGLFGTEVSRVLGGGLVPGVGKSTLMLQIAAIIAEGKEIGKPAPVLYVSECRTNWKQSRSYGNQRRGIDILQKAQVLSPRALIIDSIQTVHLMGVTGSAGGIYQIKECTAALLRFAKKTNIPIGHVTKSGDIAGPRALEHIVDAVLYMEGEQYSSHRLLRAFKNRFGSTDELGVFEMSPCGLKAVTNPSEIFLSEERSDSEFLAGLAIAVIMDGSRTFVIEIQALCAPGSSLSRQVNGVQAGRADMIISAIFLNVVSGLTLTETAGDLAFPIPNDVAFIGEVGLGGELRMVPKMEKRVSTVAKLGYKKCVVPKSAEKSLRGLDFGEIEILECINLKEVINAVFVTR
ncbi:DNA repair protein RadA [Cynara cardunculus var. scolymus]|uniref:DNA repair protein RadA n=1 Tax=Cynara cardunculus var. scolymus TaxID=59895 RepID=A0A124SGB9_CYNCS|nr:DNA repair protein RadA [Cynara cardunculus var. scolymus]